MPLLRLQQYQLGAPGLSSYRATVEANFLPLFVGRVPQVSDEEWLKLFASRMIHWFAMERTVLSPDSPSLLQVLQQRGYIDLEAEFGLDFNRITGVK